MFLHISISIPIHYTREVILHNKRVFFIIFEKAMTCDTKSAIIFFTTTKVTCENYVALFIA